MKPNLFNDATSELSQDAFIAWLLQWASPHCKTYDPDLHACASDFTKRLLSLQTSSPDSIKSIKAGRKGDGKKHIDVWAEVNDDLLLIIEDKTFTGKHSGQLPRYRQEANERCERTGRKLVCVYLKTGSESSSSLNEVRKEGFAVFSRKDFIESLDCPSVKNDIFNDFRDRIISLEEEESQYPNKNIADWTGPDWKGFYQGLEEQLGRDLGWGIVNPPGGGQFWNATLNTPDTDALWDDRCIYMQIEQGPLCFKICEFYEKQSEVRDKIHRIIMECCKGRMDIKRPQRLGAGKCMTVARVERKDWLGADNEKVDMNAVADRIKDYESLLRQVIRDANQSGAASSNTTVASTV